MLPAPLAKQPGGFGLCKGESMVFPNGMKTPPRKPEPKANRRKRSAEEELLEGDLDELLSVDEKPHAPSSADLKLPVTKLIPVIFALDRASRRSFWRISHKSAAKP